MLLEIHSMFCPEPVLPGLCNLWLSLPLPLAPAHLLPFPSLGLVFKTSAEDNSSLGYLVSVSSPGHVSFKVIFQFMWVFLFCQVRLLVFGFCAFWMLYSGCLAVSFAFSPGCPVSINWPLHWILPAPLCSAALTVFCVTNHGLFLTTELCDSDRHRH